jgi:hypothetical protein
MVQRIQSLYLSLTILLSLPFFKGCFLKFIDKSGYVINISLNGIMRNSTGTGFELIEKLLPLSVIIIIIPVLSLITILLFKNRKIQLRFALLLILVASGLIIISVYYSWFVFTKYGAVFTPGFKMVIPVLILILTILTYRGIRKDDRLVKSYDRLR